MQSTQQAAVWHRPMVHVAELARLSPDPSSQNAATLFDQDLHPVAEAVNEFPFGVAYSEARWERPTKYAYIEHAERGSIYAAARAGVATEGLTMVCLWAACPDCARAIIQAGISRLVTMRPTEQGAHAGWDDGIAVAMGMLAEARVQVEYLDGPLGVTVRRNGRDILC